MVIWKWPITAQGAIWDVPRGAKPLTVQAQHGAAMVWMLADPKAETVQRVFRVVGTGEDFEPGDGDTYVGTYQMFDGGLIWHVFLGAEPTPPN